MLKIIQSESLAFYSDAELESFFREFSKPENKDKIILTLTDSAYVSWYELVREWRSRQNMYDIS